jgi:hypothetical protein
MRTSAKIGILVGAVALALVASGALEVSVRWLPNDAYALDLFGKSDAKSASEPADAPSEFWQRGSGKAPIVPSGVPNSFADLAEASSPAS